MADITKCLKDAGVTNKDIIALAKKYKNDPKLLNKRMVEISEAAQLRKRQAILQKDAIKRIDAIFEEHKDVPRAKILADLMSGSGARGLGIVPLEREIDAVLSPVHRELAEMMEAYRAGKLGFNRSKAGQRNMVRAIFKETITDQDAMKYGDMWISVIEKLRKRFNNAGGGITKLEDWNLPQSHDPVKLGKVDFEEWYADTRPLIMDERIIPEAVDAAGQTKREEAIKKTLQSVYDNLKTDGYTKIDTSFLPTNIRRKIGNRHQEHRLLHFKNADSWMKYSDKYGAQDYFNSMMGYTELMAREIAAMEKFGPNSDAVVDRLVKSARVGGHTGMVAKNTYDEIMGRNYGFTNKSAWVSQALRNTIVGAKIGGAMVPAMTDTFFTALTAGFNGMPIIKTTLKTIAGLATHGSDRVTLNQIGLLGEYALNRAVSANRLSEVWGYGITARFADMTVRASGLNYWTTSLKETFQLEMAANLGRVVGRTFDKLPRRIRRSLERYNINSTDWNLVRGNDLYRKGGAEFFDLSKIEDRETLGKFVSMLKEETSFAIPEPNAKAKAMLHQGTMKGTLAGEFARFVGQFKAFPVAMMLTHMHRAVNLTGASRLGYLGSLIVGGTALGMAIVQAKDVLRGKTPREVNLELVRDGLLQAGITGLLGDFIFDDPNAFGGAAKRLLGPAMAEVFDSSALLYGTATDLANEEKKVIDRLAGQGMAVAKRWVPGSLWYTKLAIERYVMDSIHKTIDPKWYSKQRRLTRSMKRNKGQEWWWEPGEKKPTGAPVTF